MIIALIIVGSIIAYVVTGAALARLRLPAIVNQNVYHRGDLIRRYTPEYHREPGYNHSSDGVYREAVIADTWRTILGWPIIFPIFVINSSVHERINQMDPAVHARQEERIRELERELNIS